MNENPQWTAEQIEAMKRMDAVEPRLKLAPIQVTSSTDLRPSMMQPHDPRPLHEQVLGFRLW